MRYDTDTQNWIAADGTAFETEAACVAHELPAKEPEDRSCIIELFNVLGWPLDAKMLGAIMQRVQDRYIEVCSRVDVYPMQREKGGFLHWHLRLHYRRGGVMTIGCVQRMPDAEIEFHS